MTDHADQLRAAFESHENETPDPIAVFGRVEELSKKYHRRRRSLQIAGGSVLGVGLIAGALNLAPILPGHQSGNSGGVQLQVGAPLTPSAGATFPPQTAAQQAADWAAYFKAGYGYDDAVALAKLWHSTAQIGDVKAEAGRRLLAGETLPFKPMPTTPAPPVDPNAQKDWTAFFNAGYVYADAVTLGKLWHMTDTDAIKVKAGKELLAGEKLPIKPKPANVAAAKQAADEEAYFNAGYNYDDAVTLGKLWHVTPDQAKITGGKKLLAGETLPIKP